MNAIGLIGRGRETWHEMKGRRPGLQGLGELPQDLRHRISVPDRSGPVHRRAQQELDIGSLSTGIGEDLETLGEDGLNVESSCGGHILRAGDEVCHARQGDDVDLGSHRLNRLREGDQATAGHDLRTRHQGTITAVDGAHVTLDIRVSDDRKAKRHHDSFLFVSLNRPGMNFGKRKLLHSCAAAAKR